MLAIVSLRSDFIFLSDLRLNSRKQISAVHDLEKKFFLNGYTFYHNSVVPNRGVGILIKNKIVNGNLVILSRDDGIDCNSIILKLSFMEKIFALCSVYGPNHDTEIEFYDDLQNRIEQLNCPVILGGDWNATLDDSPVESNIDIVNMRAIPSIRRTRKILELCDNLSIVDPFRASNPQKKEYTYVPSGLNDQNRSRLDYFLISHRLLNYNTRCIIPHSLTSTLFDHKPVELLLCGKKRVNCNIIKDTILKNADLPAYVKLAVTECYLRHWTPGVNADGTVTDRVFVENKILFIGRIYGILAEIKELELNMAKNGATNLDELNIAGLRTEILLLMEELPNQTFLENLSLAPDPSVFFETLVNCIKNNVLSHQAFIYKTRGIKKLTLTKRIVALKRDFGQNSNLILETERELSNLVESELKDELLHFKKFETLNDEKITPHFMSIVKTKSVDDSIENIKKDDGGDFENEAERKNYLRTYYKSIYAQPDNRAKNTSLHDIDEFLGPVATNPIVLNAKLTEDEKAELELDISDMELTQSIIASNMASAPGADGVSNRFIKHFWEYFKQPLLKLCRHCYSTGTLPLFFKTANIKLIPKKGDLSKVKNWRPISLLNCFYKIISRVVTLRLRKFMDKMTPVSQKGYSSSRYCQEVLINVIETIEKCNKMQKKGGLLSLDIKKAFDSLSHSYLQSVYDFYNFGPKIKKWITLLCTGRKACIKLDADSYTELFDLERGNAQGDTISPFLFNLGYQILLFKLELTLQIEGILGDLVGRLNGFLVQHGHRDQVSHSDPKAFALADDCSLLVEPDPENLQKILDVLKDFELISGLECNVEKTALMLIGTNDPPTQDIIDIGFEIKSEIVLLGATIKNTGISYTDNIENIIRKIRRQSNFWKRFSLSLPGRISVAKTFLYSQINYLGCFLPISPHDIKKISLEIETFVKGKLKISKHRIFSKKSEGGLDLIDIGDYIGSQCCAWVKRAYKLDDLGKRELFFFLLLQCI